MEWKMNRNIICDSKRCDCSVKKGTRVILYDWEQFVQRPLTQMFLILPAFFKNVLTFLEVMPADHKKVEDSITYSPSTLYKFTYIKKKKFKWILGKTVGP